MNKGKKYYHWIYGENIIREDTPTYLLNLEIGVSIRFSYEQGFFMDFDDFFKYVADVQFFYGDRPNEERVEEILIDAWNFLCHFEQEEENQQELRNLEDDIY